MAINTTATVTNMTVVTTDLGLGSCYVMRGMDLFQKGGELCNRWGFRKLIQLSVACCWAILRRDRFLVSFRRKITATSIMWMTIYDFLLVEAEKQETSLSWNGISLKLHHNSSIQRATILFEKSAFHLSLLFCIE